MTRILLSLSLLIPFVGSVSAGQEDTVRRRDAAPAKFWMQRYPIRQFSSTAHIDLEVADFDWCYKQVRKFIKKYEGAQPSAITRSPEDTVKYQQFSVVFERKKAAKIIARLRKLGTVRRESQNEILSPEIPREAGTKLAQLEMERAAGKDNLRALSSVRAVLDELMGHLKEALDAYESSKDKVLVTIIIEQTGA